MDIKIDGLDLIDVVTFVTKKRDKFLAIMLTELETVIDPDSEEYKLLRKIILDGINDYTRSLLRILFGDVENLIMK